MKTSATIVRPYSTHYFHSVSDDSAAYTSQGASASEQGAIRACVVRLFLGQYEKAIVYDRRTGVAVYNVRRAGHGFRVGLGSGIDFKKWENGRG